MEPDELKATWQRLEEALERGNRFHAEILRRQKMDAARHNLKPLAWNQAFQIFFGVLFIVLAAILWAGKPSAASVIVGGAIVQLYGIGCILTAGLVLSALHRVDYAKSVVDVQTGLAEVRKAYGIAVLVAGASWWFLWVPLLMLLVGLVHIDLYARAPLFIWICAIAGLLGSFAMYWAYRHAVRSKNMRLRRFVERATFGRSLMCALEQIDEIRNFEKETAGVDR